MKQCQPFVEKARPLTMGTGNKCAGHHELITPAKDTYWGARFQRTAVANSTLSTGSRGFTLIELMLVVSIISIISAVAIPNVIRARLNANESAAMKTAKSIFDAQASYYARNGTFAPDWDTLTAGPVPYLSGADWTDGVRRSGYLYTMNINNPYSCTVDAVPAALNSTGTRAFHVDSAGAIHAVDGVGPATGADPIVYD